MESSMLMQFILSGIFACVGIALIVTLMFVIRLVNQARKTTQHLEEALMPSLANIEAITNEAKPLVTKTEPLLDRVHLSFDAINLELMRVDQILEDVSEISKSAARATNTIEAATQAPLTLVSSLTDKIKEIITPTSSSKEAQELGAKHAEVSDDPISLNQDARIALDSVKSQDQSADCVSGELATCSAPTDKEQYFTYKQ